eukprot:6196260-Pleurochrysis_carterae.AAC.2
MARHRYVREINKHLDDYLYDDDDYDEYYDEEEDGHGHAEDHQVHAQAHHLQQPSEASCGAVNEGTTHHDPQSSPHKRTQALSEQPRTVALGVQAMQVTAAPTATVQPTPSGQGLPPGLGLTRPFRGTEVPTASAAAYPAQLASLTEMGFGREQAQAALS